jgi:hypothetical protein
MAGFRKKSESEFIPPLVVKEHKQYEFKGGVVKYWTVRWHYNGKPLDPVFEKRDFYQTDSGLRMGKAKGLNLADLKWLTENWDSVVASITGGPAPAAQPEPDAEPHDVFA